MILPVVKRFSFQDTTIIQRSIPAGANILVSEGDKVTPETILAEGVVSAGQRLLQVAKILGVNKHKVKKHLTRKIGDKIFKNEVLARKEGLFGLGKKVVTSSIDGEVMAITSEGDVMVKFLPEQVRVVSGARGKILQIKKDELVIETLVHKVFGVVGTGRIREGIIKIAAKPNEFILESNINGDDQNKILVGGASIGRSALEKAVKSGVRGIVVGGINYADFLSFGVGSDVGFTLVVTEGFGILPMGEDIFNKVKESEGYFGFVDGKSSSLSIPVMAEFKEKLKIRPVKWREPKANDLVRVLDEQRGELVGTLISIEGEKTTDYGVKTQMAVIELKLGKIQTPLANLEIVQN